MSEPLITVRMRASVGNNLSGTLCGFTREHAATLVAKGLAAYWEPPAPQAEAVAAAPINRAMPAAATPTPRPSPAAAPKRSASILGGFKKRKG